MDFRITAITPYNHFVKKPPKPELYYAHGVINHNVYRPLDYQCEEKDIPKMVEDLKKVLQYFKGEHSINVGLIDVEYLSEPQIVDDCGHKRDYKLHTKQGGKELSTTLKVDNSKIAKVISWNGGSLSGSGWFFRSEFGEGIQPFEFGCICSSYRSTVEEWTRISKNNPEISHWEFQEIRKKRMVKCNFCDKKIVNLEAEQCSECGRYFCKDCLSGDVCLDCQGDD